MTEFRWINCQLDLRYSTADMYRYSHFKNIGICSAALKLLQVNPKGIARIYLHTSLLLCPLLQLIFVKIGCDIHLSAQQCSCSRLSAGTLRILEPFGTMLLTLQVICFLKLTPVWHSRGTSQQALCPFFYSVYSTAAVLWSCVPKCAGREQPALITCRLKLQSGFQTCI